jgi:hypothetical protein
MKERRVVRAALAAGLFAAGFLCGSVGQRSARAQLGDLGTKAIEKAAGSGGIVGSVAKLGTALVDMQKEVDGLQKNLETLKEVKKALGG